MTRIERDFTDEDLVDGDFEEPVTCSECGDPLEDDELIRGSRCGDCRAHRSQLDSSPPVSAAGVGDEWGGLK